MTRPDDNPTEIRVSGKTLPIILTRIYRPTVSVDLVCRERLHKHLDLARRMPLTLVSAPAGYGKSMLVSHWVESCGDPCAWISLEESDSDLRQFAAYLIAAVDTVESDVLRSTREFLDAGELPPISVLAGTVINELDTFDTPCLIVLDDYHRIDRLSAVHDFMSRILEHPPRQIHFVLVTRRDPPLRLGKLRAGNRIGEVRLQDLRFTIQEAADLLTREGYAVGDDAIVNLNKEVEGWAAGLRLVALALRRAADPDGFLKGLHGGIPHTQEYLLDEVLAAQAPAIRDCLLKSSILDRFCAPLLEAIFSSDAAPIPPEPGGQEIMNQLCNSNLFTIALDPWGEWARYHHLFQALLRRQLRRRLAPDDIAALHARASGWFESEGFISESIQHALAAGDAAGAAEVVERHRRSRLDKDEWISVKGWLDLLPAEIVHQREELLLTQAWIDFFQFRMEHVALMVEQIETLLADRALEPESMAELNFFRSYLLYWQGDGARSRRCCEEAMKLCSKGRGLTAGQIEAYFALTHQMTGDGTSAIESLKKKIQETDPTARMYLSRAHVAMSFVHLLSGDLAPAVHAAGQTNTVAEKIPGIYAGIWATYLQALAQFHAYQLDDALRGFRFAEKRRVLFERRAAIDSLVGLVLTHQFMQRPDRATRTEEEFIAFVRELGEPQYAALAGSSRARLWLLQGKLKPAVDWASSVDIEPYAPGMFVWLEDPSITRARVQIAEGTEAGLRRASKLLNDLRRQLEAMHNTYQAIDVVVLQAVALDRQGRTDEALVALESAVALAEPGGWIRPFVEAGPVMAALLQTLGSWGEREDFINQVLSAYPSNEVATLAEAPVGQGVVPPVAEVQPTADALTGRELEILGLLARRLQNKEISARLFISAHTVNDHLKHIYEKLGVKSRRQAVARAAETGILDLRSPG